MVLYSFLLYLGVLPMGKVMLQCLPAPRDHPPARPLWGVQPGFGVMEQEHLHPLWGWGLL